MITLYICPLAQLSRGISGVVFFRLPILLFEYFMRVLRTFRIIKCEIIPYRYIFDFVTVDNIKEKVWMDDINYYQTSELYYRRLYQ